MHFYIFCAIALSVPKALDYCYNVQMEHKMISLYAAYFSV